jgi:ABC-type hemin transport system ATPase subunit
VVVVLHDLGLAAAYAHGGAILSAGRVVADGPPAGIFDEGVLSEVYRQPVEVFPHPRTGSCPDLTDPRLLTCALPVRGVRFNLPLDHY